MVRINFMFEFSKHHAAIGAESHEAGFCTLLQAAH